jgi:hypothetical protein
VSGRKKAAETRKLVPNSHLDNLDKLNNGNLPRVCVFRRLSFSNLEADLSIEVTREPAGRIEIPGDVLVTDSEFCALVLGGATRRTASRLEAEGLPFAMVAGRKYRPLNEGRAWLAARIQRRSQPPQKRRASRDPGVSGPKKARRPASRSARRGLHGVAKAGELSSPEATFTRPNYKQF